MDTGPVITVCSSKQQCDLPRHCKDGRFLFVDGLSGLFCPAGFAASELGAASEGRAVLRDSHLESVYQAVRESIDKVKGQRPECRVLLLLDGLDLLLAATGADVESLLDVVSSLREVNLLSQPAGAGY